MESSAVSMLDTLAGRLDGARLALAAIVPPPEYAGLSLAAAYDLQDAVVARRSRTDRQSGWKLGATSPVKQQVMGIDHPLFGRLFAAGERASGDRAVCADFIAPRSEPELAFGLIAEIDPTMDADALLAAVGWIAPALEITDSRYRPGMRTAVELVSDNTSASGYVLGERVAPPRAGALDGFATELVRNGVVVERGSTADVLGHPLNALAALAVHLASRGLRAGAGDVVMSGAITDAVSVARGDVIEARLTGLGSASVSFV
jgi:2-oxo-3-hexenedioate decarboxylase